MKFKVIDTKTGKEPDLREIALNEDWAKRLIYCDMEGFAIEDDGTLLLLDECGNYAYPPLGRFKTEMIPYDVVTENRRPATEEEVKAWISKKRRRVGSDTCCFKCLRRNLEGQDVGYHPKGECTFQKCEENPETCNGRTNGGVRCKVCQHFREKVETGR